jgi:Histidine kinase-, DNA gyrase B-, and HSP90-like ATPase
MGRILKDNGTVPLFFGQTLIQSLRDVGYNHTTSALCEHVDNAIQAGATEIRVYFRQTGKRGDYQIDAAVYDNGSGMPATLNEGGHGVWRFNDFREPQGNRPLRDGHERH